MDDIGDSIKTIFEEIQESIKNRSWERLREEIIYAENLEDLRNRIEEKKIVRVSWCTDAHCAFQLKDMVSGEVRGTLWEGEEIPSNPCIVCGDNGKVIAYVSRTY